MKYEAINAHKQTKRQQLQEVMFSDLAPREESQLNLFDTYFENGNAETFALARKEITAKLLAIALLELPGCSNKAEPVVEGTDVAVPETNYVYIKYRDSSVDLAAEGFEYLNMEGSSFIGGAWWIKSLFMCKFIFG